MLQLPPRSLTVDVAIAEADVDIEDNVDLKTSYGIKVKYNNLNFIQVNLIVRQY